MSSAWGEEVGKLPSHLTRTLLLEDVRDGLERRLLRQFLQTSKDTPLALDFDSLRPYLDSCRHGLSLPPGFGNSMKLSWMTSVMSERHNGG